jgi:hypothetical protein
MIVPTEVGAEVLVLVLVLNHISARVEFCGVAACLL